MLDMANRVVSIDLDIHEVGAGMLCYGHAERVVVPKGWTLEDRREHEPRLFDVGAPQERLPSNLRSDRGDSIHDEDGERGYEGGSRGGTRGGSRDTDDDDQDVPGARRRERRRRALLQPEPAPDGQLALEGYDLPSEYRRGAPVRSPVIDGDDADGSDGELRADRAQNPLLARAFDLTRGRRIPSYLAEEADETSAD
jgi:hypothetical protein